MTRWGGALALLLALVRPAQAQPVDPEPPDPIEVTVEGDRAEPGGVSFGRKEIREMPGVLNDPFRAIETEPGVTPVASGVPFYFIRGAPPSNVAYSFDGIPVPMLFHVGAGPSVIPPGLVQRVELHRGPYPVTFGRVAGAVVEAEAVPMRDEWHGEAAGRVVDVGGLVEGPLPDRRGSLLAGGHFAVGAEILSALVPSVDIRYGDYQARGSFRVGGGGTLSLLTFGAYDFMATVTPAEEGREEVRDVLLDSDFHRVDLRYVRPFDDGGSVELGTTLGLDQSRGLGVERARDFRLNTRVKLERPLAKRVRLRAGLDVTLDNYDVTPGGQQQCTTAICSEGLLGASTEAELAQAFALLFPSRIDLAVGAYLDALIVMGPRATLTPGLRVDYYHSLGKSDLAVDPKLVGRLGVTDWLRFVPSIAVASQLPGFPPLPGMQIGGIPGGLQRALQQSFGAELATGPIDLIAGVFRQVTFNLTDSIGGKRGGGFASDRFLTRSTGDGYGLELSAKGAVSRNIFFLASYTLSRTTRQIEGTTLPSAYDRTHVAQAATLFDFGKNWKGGVRGLFYTGFPADEESPYRRPSADPDRVKPFFRLDVRLSKRWVFRRTFVGLAFDVQNATLAKEVFDVSCGESGCVPREIGPIAIPTMLIEAGF